MGSDEDFDTTPDVKNLLKATRLHDSLTSKLSTISPEELGQLQWAQTVMQRNDDENPWYTRGFTGVPQLVQHVPDRVLNGEFYEEVGVLAASTAGGKAIGAGGLAAGAAAGFFIGGPVGAVAGGLIGEHLGSVLGGATAGHYVEQNQMAKKYREAGYDYPDITPVEALTDVLKDFGAIMITSTIVGTALRVKFSQKVMRNSWSGNIGGEGVRAKTYNNYGALESAGITAGLLPPPSTPPSTPPGTPPGTPPVPTQGGPQGGPLEGKRRFNIYDLTPQEPWRIIQHVDPNAARTYWDFDLNKPVKSMEDVSKAMLEGHMEVMNSDMNQEARVNYLFGTALNVGDFADSLGNIYVNDILTEGLVPKGSTWAETKVAFGNLRGDKDAQLEMVKYIFGESNSIGNYHPVLKNYADNAKTLFNASRSHWHALGVPLQEIDNFMPQQADPFKMMQVGRDGVVADLMAWHHHVKMGNLTQQEQEDAAHAIYNSRLQQDTLDSLSYTGSKGGTPLGKRVSYFNDAQSYFNYMQKYGQYDNIFELIYYHALSTARSQALVTQFGPQAKDVFTKLILELDKQPTTTAQGDIMRRGVSNLASAFFSFGDSGFIGAHGMIPGILRTYHTINSLGINIMTKNNILYELFETPLNLAILNEVYGPNEDSVKFLTEGFKNLIGDLTDLFSKGKLTHEQEEALFTIGLHYDIGKELFPYNLSRGDNMSMPMWAREANHWISKVKMTDDMNSYNKKVAAMSFQHATANMVGSDWSSLTPEQRGLLQSGGITRGDWRFIQDHKDQFIVQGKDLKTIFDIDEDRFGQFSKMRYDLMSYNKAITSRNRRVKALGFKLAAVQNDFVYRVATQSSKISQMALMGASANSQSIAGHLVRNLFSLRGYAIDRVARSLSMWDLEGHAPTMGKFATFFGQRLAIGYILGAVRWSLSGRKIELDNFQDWVRLTADCLSRGDVFPFSLLAEMFNDSYNTQNNNFSDSLMSVGAKGLGPGVAYAIKKMENLIDLGLAAKDGDSTEAFKNIRRLNPLGDWLPTDFMTNRVILDNLFKSMDEEGAYELFKKEVRSNNRSIYKYMDAPGDYAGFDVRTDVAQKAEQNQIVRDVSKAKKSGEEHPLQQKRTKTMQKVTELKRRLAKTDDPKEQAFIMQQIDFVKARFDYEVAAYYDKNRPDSVPQSHTERVLKRMEGKVKIAEKREGAAIAGEKKIARERAQKKLEEKQQKYIKKMEEQFKAKYDRKIEKAKTAESKEKIKQEKQKEAKELAKKIAARQKQEEEALATSFS